MVRGRTWLLRNSLSGGPAEVTFDFGLTGDRKVMGDWNGDGTRTPGVFRDGTWYLRDRNGPGGRYISFPFGAAGDRPSNSETAGMRTRRPRPAPATWWENRWFVDETDVKGGLKP